MKHRLLSLLIVLALCLTLIPGALAWDGETDWQDAYRAFLLEEGFRKTGRTYSDSADYPIRFSLYDLDGDFRPELLLRDPMRAMAQEPYDVYTVRNGAVEYVGRIGIRGGALHYAPGRGHDGVFSYDGSLSYYTGWYYTMADGTLVTQRVIEAVITNDQITETWVTADAGLKAAFSAAYDGPVTKYTAKNALPAFSINEIEALGWDVFAEGSCGVAHFTDVAMKDWFAYSAGWAAERKIALGTAAGVFTPGGSCTRAQMITFLWRLMGEPEAEAPSAFSDVNANAYYAAAVDWATEAGVTKGVSKTRFAPNAAVTRGQAVTLLWRLAGEPEAGAASAFADVPAERYDSGAVAWAAEQGVTLGVSATRFQPDDACTRAQIVTFLCRACDALNTKQEA